MGTLFILVQGKSADEPFLLCRRIAYNVETDLAVFDIFEDPWAKATDCG